MGVTQAVMIIQFVAVCALVVDVFLLVGAGAAVYRYLRQRRLAKPATIPDHGATRDKLRTYT